MVLLVSLSMVFLLFSQSLYAGEKTLIINKEACPFECCGFGSWTARETIKLFEAPEGKITESKIKKGEKITALTGEVHSKPLPARVTHVWKTDEKQGIHIGDLVYILHGLGEGAVALWHDDKVKKTSMDLKYELLNKNGPKFPTSVWWVKIRLKDGTEAWIKNPRDFDGMDKCS